MTDQQFTSALRAFARRKPFRDFLIEFHGGAQVRVRHPEGVAPLGKAWFLIQPEGERMLFASDSVCRLLDATAS